MHLISKCFLLTGAEKGDLVTESICKIQMFHAAQDLRLDKILEELPKETSPS